MHCGTVSVFLFGVSFADADGPAVKGQQQSTGSGTRSSQAQSRRRGRRSLDNKPSLSTTVPISAVNKYGQRCTVTTKF